MKDRILILNTFFFTFLPYIQFLVICIWSLTSENRNEYGGARRQYKEQDLFNYDQIIIPINDPKK